MSALGRTANCVGPAVDPMVDLPHYGVAKSALPHCRSDDDVTFWVFRVTGAEVHVSHGGSDDATVLESLDPCSRGLESVLGSGGATVLGGEHGGLGASFHAELGQQARDVVLDRLLGQEHSGGNLSVGQALAK